MKDFIEQLGIAYTVEGEGSPLVIFHGWGCNKEMFEFLITEYKNKYKVYAFDLPGFGESLEPSKVINTEEHSEIMIKAFELLGIHNPIGLGHSHGGRILIKMATKIQFEKLILTGSAGVVNKRPLSYYVKVYTYKTLKKLYEIPLIKKMFPAMMDKYRKNAGSEDYRNASDIMKGVLSTVVNEDLRNDFPLVTIPTLLIWGDKDTATPLTDGQLMEEKMPDAGLVVFNGGTHFAFLEQRSRFITVLNAFI